jgi:hypothetical protein
LLALKASILAVLAPAELMCGADVEIHSLVRSPELNGVRSKVVEPQDPGSGRWGVKIDSDGRVLAEASQPGPDQEARTDGAAAWSAGGADRGAEASGDTVE